MNSCGTCSMCCKLPVLPVMNKPANKWCEACKPGSGCTRYDDRPNECVEFACLWLQLQDSAKPLAPELRPDRSKVVIAPSTNESALAVFTDPAHPHAHKRDDVAQLLGRLAMMGMTLVVGEAGVRQKVLMKRDGMVVTRRTIQMTEPDENGMQWFNDEPSEVP